MQDSDTGREVPPELVTLGNEVEQATLSVDRLQEFLSGMSTETDLFSSHEVEATEQAIARATSDIESKSLCLKNALRVWQYDIGQLTEKKMKRADIIAEYEGDLARHPELMQVLADGQVAVEQAIDKASTDIGVSGTTAQ
jgi:hypothetical protein